MALKIFESADNSLYSKLNLLSYQSFTTFEAECRLHMKRNGIAFHGKFIPDGKIHRFSKDNQKDLDEFYSLHVNFTEGGHWICIYGTWSGGYREYHYKSFENDASISEEEKKRHHEEWRRKQHEVVAKLLEEKIQRIRMAQKVWEKASTEPLEKGHTEYLLKKKVGKYGIRFGKNKEGKAVLIVPLRNFHGEIQAVQYIDSLGEKRIYGSKKGNFHIIGEVREKSHLYISEGYATAATVHEATGEPAIVAFDCGNLLSVIESVGKIYGYHPMTIAADNDLDVERNPGRKKAEEAAQRFKCDVMLPYFSQNLKLQNGTVPTDFNDLHVLCGIEAVRKQLLKKKTRLISVHLGEFLSKKIPSRRLILDPCFHEQSLNMLYAPRGIGKTFISLSLGLAIASGGQIVKFRAPEPRRVLYVDGEMPASSMQERLLKLLPNEKQFDPTFFKLITPDLQEGGIRDISTKEGQGDINDHLQGVDFLILDNLSTLIQSKSENEAEDWIPVQQWLLMLRKWGIAVLLIHHAGKNGQQRGSSKKEDILDTVISIRRTKNWTACDGAHFEWHFEKNRGFDGDQALPIEVSLTMDENGRTQWTYRELEERELNMIGQLYQDGMSQREISKEMKVSLGKVNNLIKQAKKEGIIR